MTRTGPRGKTVMGHAQRGGQASDQANGNTDQGDQQRRTDKSWTRHPNQRSKPMPLGVMSTLPTLTFLQCHLALGNGRPRGRNWRAYVGLNLAHHSRIVSYVTAYPRLGHEFFDVARAERETKVHQTAWAMTSAG